MNAVAPGSTTQDNDRIAGMRVSLHEIARHHADATTIDQRIADVVVIEPHRAIEGGDAHAVAVVAHSRNDFHQDSSRMQTPRR